jgi:hypothetical protein
MASGRLLPCCVSRALDYSSDWESRLSADHRSCSTIFCGAALCDAFAIAEPTDQNGKASGAANSAAEHSPDQMKGSKFAPGQRKDGGSAKELFPSHMKEGSVSPNEQKSRGDRKSENPEGSKSKDNARNDSDLGSKGHDPDRTANDRELKDSDRDRSARTRPP